MLDVFFGGLKASSVAVIRHIGGTGWFHMENELSMIILKEDNLKTKIHAFQNACVSCEAPPTLQAFPKGTSMHLCIRI